MQLRGLTLVALASCAGCGSEAPDDKLNVIRAPQIPRMVSAQEALNGAHIATLDPATMNDAEISKALGDVPFCAFRYVSDGRPVLAWKRSADDPAIAAVVKLNGQLVTLQNDPGEGAAQFVADDVRLSLSATENLEGERTSEARPMPAELIFEIDQKLRVGYQGYSVCVP